MRLLQDKNRDFRRYRHDIKEKAFLKLNGLQHVLSSNVSAVGTRSNDLIIRFHNGSVYEYPNQASQYDSILASNSKGRWVWRFLRRARVPYRKSGIIPLPDDIDVTDEEIFQEIDNRYFKDITKHVQVPVFQSFEFIKGINMQKIEIGNIKVYKAINKELEVAKEPKPIMYDDLQFETNEQLVEYLKQQEITLSEIEDILLEMKVKESEIKKLLEISKG